jgi:hypothetical protein
MGNGQKTMHGSDVLRCYWCGKTAKWRVPAPPEGDPTPFNRYIAGTGCIHMHGQVYSYISNTVGHSCTVSGSTETRL